MTEQTLGRRYSGGQAISAAADNLDGSTLSMAVMRTYGLTMEELELEQVLAANMNGYLPGGSRPSVCLYAAGEPEDNRERYRCAWTPSAR